MSPAPPQLISSFDAVSKQGAAFDDDDSKTNKYYGFLAEIEDVVLAKGDTPEWSVQFELVPFEWMEAAVLSQKGTLKALPPRSPATLLVFDTGAPEKIAEALNTPVEEVNEGEWYIITLGKSSGYGAKRAKPLAGAKSTTLKAQGRKADPKQRKILIQRFKPTSKWSAKKLKQMLAAMAAREVGVMDVGQASCNLVYNDQGVPQVYVDVGLPMFFYLASIPPANGVGNFEVINPGPCQANNPPVILTHWHWDHWAMGLIAANQAQLWARNWIVPQQPLGGAGMNLVLSIVAGGGNVHVFPVGLAGLVGGYIQIIQCGPAAGIAPGDLNNSGIAVVITVNVANDQRVLLPGDAAYQSIPGLAAVNGLRWMTATHHGSDTNLNAVAIPAPDVAGQGKLAYSYGIIGGPPGGVHCYGHPRAAAVAAYPAAGWGGFLNVASTAETGPNSNVAGRGNIMMSQFSAPPACGVAGCPFHTFPIAKRLA